MAIRTICEPGAGAHAGAARVLLIILFVGVLAGCATPGLSPRAREVQLVMETPERLEEEYDEISVLSCRRDLNVGDLDTNVMQCQNQLKNEAARLGGDLLIVNERELGRAGCESCVTIVATAYRRK